MSMRIVALIIVAAGALALSCGDSPTGGYAPRLTFVDFVHFDTTKYLLVKQLKDPHEFGSEPFLSWEQSFGEPFIDVNGNMVYDEGIDIFTKCVCPQNHDLNFNGQHDGPDAPWTRGIPFDDINGDDSCQQRPLLTHRRYQPGVPFVDVNDNGIYDSTLSYVPFVVRCYAWTDSAGETYYYYRPHDSVYTFISDSAVTYLAPDWIGEPENLFRGKLAMNDSGLVYTYGYSFHVLDTGAILPVTAQKVEVPWYPYDSTAPRLTFEKTVLLYQGLDVWDVHYANLLLVRFTYPAGSALKTSQSPPLYNYEFYFSREHGLVGIFYYLAPYSFDYFCFDHRFDSFPLPMTK